MLSFFFPELDPRVIEMRREAIGRRLASCVDYSPNLPWRVELNLTAKSWPSWSLFPVESISNVYVDGVADNARAISPLGQFCYVEKVLPRGRTLVTAQGSRCGSALFDGDVRIPCLFERTAMGPFSHEPWMSTTPMEVFSLRPGTRAAKGHTVIAGLGLGWQLAEVLAKRSVREVTLVEKSQELVDWLLPRIIDNVKLRYGEKLAKLNVIVGDAYEEVPKLTADVALIDIFPHYGNNKKRWKVQTPSIKATWIWGSGPAPRRD